MVILFSIIAECAALGEKLLVFSQSLKSLDVIEHFLTDDETSVWEKGLDFFRLDGTTDVGDREKSYTEFNKLENKRARYLLMSMKMNDFLCINRCVIMYLSDFS